MPKPRKRFGQHFLKDDSVLSQMVDAITLNPDDAVVEIGPGRAALTYYLRPALKQLHVVELDRDLVASLKVRFIDDDNLHVHACDALNFDFSALASAGQLRVVGNLPYNISTPLLFHLISQLSVIRDMHFMLQKEVVLRLCAPPGDSHYGRLTVMCGYWCDAMDLFDVPASAFDPPPKVLSSVVRLVPNHNRHGVCQDMGLFERIVRDAFNMRRKAIRNGLKPHISAAALEDIGVDPGKRPQEISIAEFVKIANYGSQL